MSSDPIVIHIDKQPDPVQLDLFEEEVGTGEARATGKQLLPDEGQDPERRTRSPTILNENQLRMAHNLHDLSKTLKSKP
jgi:hypothetical protein